jgi:hypothetical protein
MTTITWKRARRASSGSRVWTSECCRYQIHASEMCYGVRLDPVYYIVHVHSNIGWLKLSGIKHRSRAAAEKEANLNFRRMPSVRSRRAKLVT